MDLNLQPLAQTCFVTGQPFVEGERVLSHLVRNASGSEVMRYDVRETSAAEFAPSGVVACRWVHAFKPRKPGDTSERDLKLTAENLFLTLADPSSELNEESTRLVQFLALMLERKRLLRPKGRSADGSRNLYEHAGTKQMYEVPAGELSPEFFMAVQAQLSVLVGSPKSKTEPAAEPPATAPAAS
ncbi:hypothetical protein MASR2M8_08940 [Opitutaceae bacterium]